MTHQVYKLAIVSSEDNAYGVDRHQTLQRVAVKGRIFSKFEDAEDAVMSLHMTDPDTCGYVGHRLAEIESKAEQLEFLRDLSFDAQSKHLAQRRFFVGVPPETEIKAIISAMGARCVMDRSKSK